MRRAISGLGVAVALAAIPGTSLAQGFQVNEHGTCAMGRAGTGVASPCDDASSIFYNPAGLAGSQQGWTISAGVTAIYAFGNFVDDLNGNELKLANSIIPVPHVYAAYGKDKWAAGVGMFVPYGLGTVWPDTFEGRFLGFDNDLKSIYIQPTASYQILDWLMLGAGLDIVIGSVELTQRLDLSAQEIPGVLPPGVTVGQLGIPFHTEFAEGKLHASGATGFGGNFGVRIKPVETVDIGVRYLTRVKLDYSGTATFAQVPSGLILPPNNAIAGQLGLPTNVPLPVDSLVAGLGLFASGATLSEQAVTTSITMPDQLTVGVAIQAFRDLQVLAEWQWVHWSLFESLEADFELAPDLTLHENYRDTNGFRFGVDWATTDKVNLRGGYLYHEAAAPDQTVTPLLPEGPRNEFTFGGGFKLGSRFALDVAYQFINQDKRRGRVRDADPGQLPTADLNSGLYAFNAHLFAATFAVHF